MRTKFGCQSPYLRFIWVGHWFQANCTSYLSASPEWCSRHVQILNVAHLILSSRSQYPQFRHNQVGYSIHLHSPPLAALMLSCVDVGFFRIDHFQFFLKKFLNDVLALEGKEVHCCFTLFSPQLLSFICDKFRFLEIASRTAWILGQSWFNLRCLGSYNGWGLHILNDE